MSETTGDHVGVHHVRVRYAETDQMRVAHHGSYIPWIEEARTEWLREKGASYREMEDRGLSLAVTRLSVRYRWPVRYDDRVRIETRLLDLRRASLSLSYRLFAVDGERAGALVAEAETTLALVGAGGRPMRIPAQLFGSPP